jgi:succinoglycan biosynthesis protein ExoO
MLPVEEHAAPTVSIIVASHNKGAYVEASIRSALDQGPIVEVIVVDDASTDDSVAILDGLARDNPRVRLIKLPSNRGGSHCRNIGIREARGEFVVFLDADDLPGTRADGAPGAGPRSLGLPDARVPRGSR